MSTALNAQLLKPRLTCLPNKPPFSHRNCMRMIYNKKADITMLEAGDIYRAGEDYGLIPIMAEVDGLIVAISLLSSLPFLSISLSPISPSPENSLIYLNFYLYHGKDFFY